MRSQCEEVYGGPGLGILMSPSVPKCLSVTNFGSPQYAQKCIYIYMYVFIHFYLYIYIDLFIYIYGLGYIIPLHFGTLETCWHSRDKCHLLYKHQNTSIVYKPISNHLFQASDVGNLHSVGTWIGKVVTIVVLVFVSAHILVM